MPTEITAALIALAAVFIYALGRVIQRVPSWIERRVDAKLAKHDLAAAKVNAEAMRDRALADAYVSAASSVSQSLAIIQTLASTLDNANADADMLQRVVISLEQNARQLKELNERLSNDDSDDASSPSNRRVFGDAG